MSGLALAAVIAIAAWVALLCVLRVAFRTRDPKASPGGMDPPGDEPPAVVALITGGWSLPRTAVPATLIDLAARDVIAIEQVGTGQTLVRVPRRASPEAVTLTPYEDQVLAHVRSVAMGDVVPCEALTTGPADAAGRWWRRFRSEVMRDARDRGLSRRRWPGTARTVLHVAAIAPAILGGLLLYSQSGSSSGEEKDAFGIVIAPFIFWGAMAALVEGLNDERDTPAGLAVAGRWLGFGHYLADHSRLAEAEPASVIVRGRYLAWAAGLGLATAALQSIPMGTESATEAWSWVGGRWRQVRIRYPGVIPLGWGWKPIWALAAGSAPFVVLPLLGFRPGHLSAPIGDAFAEGASYFDWALGAAAALGLVLLAASALLAVTALTDLGRTRTVEGRVLRLRSSGSAGSSSRSPSVRVAVDDGSSDRIRAWRCPNRFDIAQGDWVTATVTPRLGYVRDLARAPDPGGTSTPTRTSTRERTT